METIVKTKIPKNPKISKFLLSYFSKKKKSRKKISKKNKKYVFFFLGACGASASFFSGACGAYFSFFFCNGKMKFLRN